MAGWIESTQSDEIGISADQEDFYRHWWNRTFASMAKIAYNHSDEVFTLYEGNRQVQISEGADPKKIHVLPNGIDLVTQERKEAHGPLRVALIGRVVEIKDIKTFIRAIALARREVPDIQALIIGPADEEPGYFNACVELVNSLHLDEVVEFTGRRDLRELYPTIDLVVLTSITESQPLVILEAAGYGIPSIATDIGSCRELIEGRTPEDAQLGPGGIVTPLANPQATADAIVELLRDEEKRRVMAKAATKRAGRYYRKDSYLATYQERYHRYKEAQWLG